jgi:hypothetical protein
MSLRACHAPVVLIVVAIHLPIVCVRSGEVRVVGCTSADKYRKFIEKDPGLERRFQVGAASC